MNKTAGKCMGAPVRKRERARGRERGGVRGKGREVKSAKGRGKREAITYNLCAEEIKRRQ